MSDVPWALKPRRPQAQQGVDLALRRLLWVRSGGLDEVTGEILEFGRFDVHHRRKRSQGRDDSPANLLVVSRRTHNRLGQHEQWARERGYVLSFGQEPATTHVLLHGRAYVLLRPDGKGYIDAELGPDSNGW